MADENEVYEEENIPDIPVDWASIKTFKPTFILNDGTEMAGSVVRSSFSDDIWVVLEDADFGYLEIVSIFSDPEKTSVIQSNNAEDSSVIYTGYTRLASVISRVNGKFTIQLTKSIT